MAEGGLASGVCLYRTLPRVPYLMSHPVNAGIALRQPFNIFPVGVAISVGVANSPPLMSKNGVCFLEWSTTSTRLGRPDRGDVCDHDHMKKYGDNGKNGRKNSGRLKALQGIW